MGVVPGGIGDAPFHMPAVEAVKALDVGISGKQQTSVAVEVSGIEFADDTFDLLPGRVVYLVALFVGQQQALMGRGRIF